MTSRRYLPLVILSIIAITRVFIARDSLGSRNSYSYTPAAASALNKHVVSSVRSVLPAVHADLLLGMTIGVNEIKNDKRFYDALVQVGLIHVVVVSGYNVALVIKFLTSVFSNRIRAPNRFFVLVGTVAYALICGAQPPVIRASLMGYVSYLATSEGRGLDGLNLVLIVCLSMLILNPTYIVSLSFWLSVLATFGLIFFEPAMSRMVAFIFGSSKLVALLPTGDLATSLACQIVVWPLISYFFGRVSLYSPFYNMLTLWLIPLCTVSGFVLVFISQLLPFLSGIAGILVFPFFDLFVRGVTFLSSVDKGNVSFSMSLHIFIAYYVALFIIALVILKHRTSK